MADAADTIAIQVCYARPDKQLVCNLRIAPGTTIHDVIRQSGIVQTSDDIDITLMRVGIFGKLKTLDTVVREHDRVEIYRPLIADPMESRRRRAVKKADVKS